MVLLAFLPFKILNLAQPFGGSSACLVSAA